MTTALLFLVGSTLTNIYNYWFNTSENVALQADLQAWFCSVCGWYNSQVDFWGGSDPWCCRSGLGRRVWIFDMKKPSVSFNKTARSQFSQWGRSLGTFPSNKLMGPILMLVTMLQSKSKSSWILPQSWYFDDPLRRSVPYSFLLKKAGEPPGNAF